jgi:hypothetical protein
MLFDIWRSGYIATGGRDNEALLFSNVEADTFEEACVKACAFSRYFSADPPRYWGCQLYPTQHEANAVFGDVCRT